MLNAILSDIPEHYGLHQIVYSHFCKWRGDGTIFQALNEEANRKNLCIDNTSVKAQKIHAMVDGLGTPVHFILTFEFSDTH